jgi:hydrogenase-4 component B
VIPLLLLAVVLAAVSGVPGVVRSAIRGHRAPGAAAGAGDVVVERVSTALLLAAMVTALAAVIACWLRFGADTVSAVWAVPGGRFELRLDLISSIFILPVSLVVAAGAMYGPGYRPVQAGLRNGAGFRFFYGLVAAALLVLLTARGVVLFMTAWEVAALSAFFLVSTDDDQPAVRRAGYLYLVATHTATLALIGMFALLGGGAELRFPGSGTLAAGGHANSIFALGLLGFGLKAGLVPLHVWLPSAHAAAPTHASAFMSGLMIKIGIYGLVRLVSFYAEVPAWWGWTLLAAGSVSAVAGVSLALAQHDIKRLLAYHSVENIGIIVMGLGLATLGRAAGAPALVVLGLGGALLHVINHGLFKALLFLAAGSAIHASGTRELERMGGLLRRQRWTAAYFLIGAVAICGLPPLNGFVSEWLVYRAALLAAGHEVSGIALAVMAVPVLAVVGGLALACFVKVFGVVFLGVSRGENAETGAEATRGMRAGMGLLAAGCLAIGLAPAALTPLLRAAAAEWAPSGAGSVPDAGLQSILHDANWLSAAAALLLVAVLALAAWLRRCRREATIGVTTWACGYAQPVPRAQYTASSLADGLLNTFASGRHLDRASSPDFFPAPTRVQSHQPDLALDRFLMPGWRLAARGFVRVRALLHNGLTAAYLLYVALTLLVLLIMFSGK